MALSSNRYVWRFLILISFIFVFLCAVLFYFQDIFIILIIGAILILLTERFLSFFNRVMDRFPNLNRRVVGIGLLASALLALVFLVNSQMQEIGILITESTKVQENYINGASALFGKDSTLSVIVDSGVLKSEDLQKIGNTIFAELTGTISKLSYYLFTGVLVIPLMCGMYFRNRYKLKAYIHETAPSKYAGGIVRAMEGIGRKLEDFFSAKMIESTVVGLICCIGFYL
ncbi:MAG: AI-2E family transporter, partial [Methanosarcinaceae archaeon]|nr:AI-2E family transporter [Methanosarcinaceae archaeon]